MTKAGRTVLVVGGGAAGFFSAINLALRNQGFEVSILEKTGKVLSKVRVSGGGRCNVTNDCFDRKELVKNYPRGQKELQQAFSRFSVTDTIQWFENHGVRLVAEGDGRMFPSSNSSEEIIDCFTGLCKKLGIKLRTGCEVHHISRTSDAFNVRTSQGDFSADAVIVACGGHHKTGFYDLLRRLGHTIIDPVPSLFTFNLPSEKIIRQNQGLAVKNVLVSINRLKTSYQGPLLVTHWGISGPAVLKLSAYSAIPLHDSGYNEEVTINWTGEQNEQETLAALRDLQQFRARALPYSTPSFDLPRRLWEFLLRQAGFDEKKPWAEVSKKHLMAIASLLTAYPVQMQGKTTFKEEFVTCGGLDLKEVDFRTMESRLVKQLYFCGEVLNIDGITGGFNFQSAWTTAWICAQSIPS